MMRFIFAAAASLLLMNAAHAQNVTPAEAAIQATTIVNQIAQLAQNQQRKIEELEKQISELQSQMNKQQQPKDAPK